MTSEKQERICLIRRAILTALKDYVTADLDEIQNHPAVEKTQASRAELLSEFNALSVDDVKKGPYVLNVPGFNGWRKQIIQRGLKQITQFSDRDIFIWGKDGTGE